MNRVIAVFVLVWLAASARGATLQGTVVDSDDRPIAGARVDIATAAPRHGEAIFCPTCYLDCAKWTQTDSEGRYEIRGLSDSLKFRVLFTATGNKSRLSELFDPLAGDLNVTLASLPAERPVERTVRGLVIDDARRAMAGALVWPIGAKSSSRRWYGRVEGVEPTVCDAEGRFAMLMPEDFHAVDLQVTADGKAGTTVQLLAPGADEHEISVPAGTRVTGRVVHRGRPVEGLRIAVVQLKRDTGHHFIKAVADTTDHAGRFDFNHIPANERYAIYTLVGEGGGERSSLVLSTKRFTAHDNHATRDLGELEAQGALHLRGHIELPEGQSLPPGLKLVVSRDPAWDLIAIPLEEDGQFDVSGFPPETYELRVAVKGFEIDPARLNFQSLSPQSFGIHMNVSIDDLRIPLVIK